MVRFRSRFSLWMVSSSKAWAACSVMATSCRSSSCFSLTRSVLSSCSVSSWASRAATGKKIGDESENRKCQGTGYTFDFLLGTAANVFHLIIPLGHLFLILFSHLLHAHFQSKPSCFQHLDLTGHFIQFLLLANKLRSPNWTEQKTDENILDLSLSTPTRSCCA